MSKKSLIILLILIIFYLNAFSQQFNNWYFPLASGLNFNTIPPTILTNGVSLSGGTSATISDNNGRLLFYTNGRDVYNFQHQLMANGSGLNGGFASSNSALIIPFLNGNNMYYIFTAYGNTFSINAGEKGYCYSVVDMNRNNGLGEIILKNKFLYKPSGEKLCAIPHNNGSDLWVVTRDWLDTFKVFKIGCGGVDETPIISVVGTSSDSIPNYNFGEIKVAPKGNVLAIASSVRDFIELFSFNNSTGKLSNSIKLPSFIKPIGLEFSPNSKFLYISAFDTSLSSLQGSNFSIFQLDISIYDSTLITNSIKKIGSRLNFVAGSLQLAPDNKIYVASFDSLLGVINFPNIINIGCNYIPNFINFSPNFISKFLPYTPFLITSQNVQIPSYTVASDCRTVTLSGKTYIKGNNLTFKWKFGDGDSTVQIIPSGGDTTYTTVTHFYPLGIDTFNVQLFITSDTVCGQGNAGKKVIVKPSRPNAKFGYSITCNQQLVTFTDSSLLNFNPSLSYQWQFFNKNNVLLGNAVAANTSFSFPTYDSFFVRLIVSSPLACVQADTFTKTIVLKAKPVSNFTYANTCGSLATTFTNASLVVADTLVSYYWSFGDGTISFNKNPNHNYTTYGTYIVKLVVNSSLGCLSDTVSLPVLIKAKPVANFIYNNNGCIGTALLLQDSAYVTNSNIATHYWQLPSGALFTTNTISPIFTTAGNQAIRYAVSSLQGCHSDTITKNVLIESIPIATINTPTNSCINALVSFSNASNIAMGQIDSSYWRVVGQPWQVQQGVVGLYNYSFAQANNYTIQHYVKSKQGCISNIASQPINIESKPNAAFSSGIACIGRQVLFTNNSSNSNGAIANSQWAVNGVFVINNGIANFGYNFSQAGNYTIGLRVSTANGCIDTLSKVIAVEQANAYAGADQTVLENASINLQASGGIGYLWQPPIGLSNANISNPVARLLNSQQYIVQVTTAQGCVGFDTVLITVLRNLQIPNAFSPNGDGINDEWRIDQLKDYPNAELQLFSRNGTLVYSAKGNNITAWKGSMNNKPVAEGTYYYLIHLNNSLRSKPYSGWVLVVR